MAAEQPEQCELVTIRNASEFLEEADSYLRDNEEISAPIIGMADLVKDEDPVFREPFAFAIAVNTDEKVLGCLAHARPDGLLIGGLGLDASDKIYAWAEDHIGAPSRISGDPYLTYELAARWSEPGKNEVDLQDCWRVYRLRAVSGTMRAPNGKLRLGRDRDAGLVATWGDMYDKEKPAFLSISAFFERKLKRGELYVWDDDGAKTLVTLSARTRNGIRISSVFTPPDFRGNGYAGAAVSGVCQMMLNKGLKFITLVAQLDDPVERLYEMVGFECIGYRSSVTFRRP